jgi:homoserine dehydrogenase
VDLSGALDLLRTGRSLNLLTSTLTADTFDFICKCEADVLFENSPVNYEDGQPAVDYIKLALESGMHVVTANKGSVVYAYRELRDLARSKGRHFFFESTVMDGAPVFSLFRSALPAAQLKSFKAILNSTTNLILTRMESGETLAAATQYAQHIGITETDPSGDIDGWDAAVKVAALATVLMDVPTKPAEVQRTGIREITPEMVKTAMAQGQRYKLICSAERDGKKVLGCVTPELVPASSPFYGIEGATSMIQFTTDVLGQLTLVEPDPSPQTTAYGLLADFINAVKA